MQPVNFLLSYNSICDNFTGLVEFIPAAVLGYHCWINQSAQASGVSREMNGVSIQALATTALLIWSLRLGIFLFYRIKQF